MYKIYIRYGFCRGSIYIFRYRKKGLHIKYRPLILQIFSFNAGLCYVESIASCNCFAGGIHYLDLYVICALCLGSERR